VFIRVKTPRNGAQLDLPEGHPWIKSGAAIPVSKKKYPPSRFPRPAKYPPNELRRTATSAVNEENTTVEGESNGSF